MKQFFFRHREEHSAALPRIIHILAFSLAFGLAFGLTPLSAATIARGESDAAVIRYHLDLHLEPERHQLGGTVTLTLPDPEAPGLLLLDEDAQVTGVRADGHQVGYEVRAGRLVLKNVPAAIRQLSIDYVATFDDPVPQNTVGVEDPSFGVAATILPEGTYLASGVAWFPQIPGRRGLHQVSISAPDGVIAVTAGRFLGQHTAGHITRTEWDSDFPLMGLALAAGRFNVAEDSLDDIQLLTFVSPANADLASRYLVAMRQHLSFYRQRLGPYPFAKFAVVENFLPTGYGLPSWTLLGRNVIRLPFIPDTSLPHEIVHSWWGNAVEIDYSSGNWGEGLATYLADYLLKERSHPEDARSDRLKILREYASLVSPEQDFALQAFRSRMSKRDQSIGYGKSAMVFHMLRQQIGDQAFWDGLKRLAVRQTGQKASWEDLRRHFEATSGQDLSWFFRQWIERSGAPDLALSDVKLSRADGIWIIQGAIEQNLPLYRLDLDLQLLTAAGPVRQTIRIDSPTTPLRIETGHRPLRLDIDPDSHLMRRLDSREIPATINTLRASSKKRVVLANGADPGWLDAADDLLRGLHWQQAERLTESQLSPAQVTDHDLLFIGWPGRDFPGLLKPQGLQIDAQSFTVEGQTFAASGDALFVTLSRSGAQGGTIGILHGNSVSAIRKVARRIPHYGRYSYLAFSDGDNRLKGTWMPPSSPLSFSFDEE